MALNPNIILSGQQFDLMGAMNSGMAAAQNQNALTRQRQIEDLYRTQGNALMQGDTNALGQLAQFDPMAAQDMLANKQQMDIQRTTAQREAERYVKEVGAEKAAADAAQARQEAMYGMSAPDPATFDARMVEIGKPEFVGRFEDRRLLGMQFVEFADAVEMIAPKPAEAPTTKTVKMPDGSDVMVQWNGQTGKWDPAPIPQGGTTGAGKGLTEGQSKLTLFQTLQEETAPVLVDLEAQFDAANLSDPSLARLPIAGNYFTSPEYQMYSTAAAAWAEGALRIATGAAATQPEIERNIKTYFAQPGDTPQTVAFKAQMREMYMRAVNNALGLPDTGERLPTPSEFAKGFPGATSALRPAAPQGPVVVDGFTIEAIE